MPARKLCFALLLCCLYGGTAYAKDVYYESFTDAKTGKQIEYFDLNEDTSRTYVTQNAWFSDNKSFIVCSEGEKRIYKYNTATKQVEAMFSPGCLPLDNAAVVGSDDAVYAKNNTDGKLYVQRPGESEDEEPVPEFTPLSMTLPMTTTDKSNYTENGLTFRYQYSDRWRESLTSRQTRGGKECRVTVCENRESSSSKGNYDLYYNSNFTSKCGSMMCFRVDNSRISSDQRNITIEFDYYDDSNGNIAPQGYGIEVKYLKYNGGATPTIGTKTVPITGTNTWKTAKVVIDDAQFNKAAGVFTDADSGAGPYDFKIGIGGNRGGFASTWIKVTSGAGSMPEHELTSEVNSEGTAFTDNDFRTAFWNTFDGDIAYSGATGMSAVDGKHYVYNKEYTKYASNEEWKRWKNGFYLRIPDSFLSGNAYTNVEIEVEYYAPTAGKIVLTAKNSSGNDVATDGGAVTTGAWTTKTFRFTSTDGKNVKFSNGFDNNVSDCRINFDSFQGYIHKVTVRKDIIED